MIHALIMRASPFCFILFRRVNSIVYLPSMNTNFLGSPIPSLLNLHTPINHNPFLLNRMQSTLTHRILKTL